MAASAPLGSGSLVPLPETSRLSPAVIRVLGGNPSKFTLQGTNTYLLGTGHERLLIDTGEGRPSWIAALGATLAAEGTPDGGRARVQAAILTHRHPDHVGGVADLLQLCPEAAVYKQRLPGDPETWRDIEDGQAFSVPGATLTAFRAPGHTADHVVLHLEEEDALFTGDAVLGQGTAVFEDLATYVDSLDRMRGLFGGRAYPAHGPVIEDGPGRVEEYVRHRSMREEQVARTLAGESVEGEGVGWTPMELVKVIYADVPENLHDAAAGGVVQILGKLEKENKVVRDRNRWKLRDRSAL